MIRCVLVILCLGFMLTASAQEEKDFFSLPLKKQEAFLKAVNGRFAELDKKLTASSERYLRRMKKQEAKLYKKLYKKDSVAAKQFLANSQQQYAELEAKLNSASNGETQKQLKEYIPQFDSIKTSLSFLNKSLPADHPLLNKLKGPQQTLSQFETRMQLANEVKRQLKERKKLLAEQFEKLGLTKDLKKLNKEMFYYQEQLKEYKLMLKDPKKLEEKALALLRKSKAFNEFMKKNSMLAQLFKVPDNYGSPASLAGLQTREGVAAMLTQRFAGAGVNPREHMQQQMNLAQAEMNKLKGKLKKTGSGNSSDIDMPENFKPNTQKTRSFLKRLEYGANIQTQRPNGLLPVTSDLALTAGYKLNDKSVIGIGASYKLGWGQGIKKIRLSSEGVALRSFVDLKLKGSFWLTGGYEQNYYQSFNSLEQLYNINAWKQSALLGLTKKVRIGKKTNKVQLLYDFFYRSNNIRTQPLAFRVEYGF